MPPAAAATSLELKLETARAAACLLAPSARGRAGDAASVCVCTRRVRVAVERADFIGKLDDLSDYVVRACECWRCDAVTTAHALVQRAHVDAINSVKYAHFLRHRAVLQEQARLRTVSVQEVPCTSCLQRQQRCRRVRRSHGFRQRLGWRPLRTRAHCRSSEYTASPSMH